MLWYGAAGLGFVLIKVFSRAIQSSDLIYCMKRHIVRTDTRTLILDAAELEFAACGFGAASLRRIIAHAKVNLAAIHYHFGSKEELISAVFQRRIGALTEERLRALDACEKGAAHPRLEDVVTAFVGPALRLTADPARGGRLFMRLLGRAMSEPNELLQAMLNRHFGPVTERFLAAIGRALPPLPPAVLHWRFYFVVGAMAMVMADPHNLKELTGGLCDSADMATATRQLTSFLAAGLGAPVARSGVRPGGRNRTKVDLGRIARPPRRGKKGTRK